MHTLFVHRKQLTNYKVDTILEGLVDDGFGSIEQVTRWLEQLENLPLLSYVVVRYCGKPQGPAWTRHSADIYSSTSTRFIVRFFRRIGSLCPNVLAQAIVQTVVPITTTFKLSTKEADLQDSVLIALFGDSTLNLEAGGGQGSITLTEADHSAFISLGPTESVHSRTAGKGLLLTALRPQPDTNKAVAEYAAAVRAYVDEHPDSTKGRYEYTDQTQETVVKQATTSMLPEASALVTIGSDFGEVEDNRIVPFFEGSSRSAVAIQDCFNQFAQWEQQLGARLIPNAVKQLARNHVLPFADLFAWFKKSPDDYPAARKLLNKYLTAVKPLVILTLGETQTFAIVTPVNSFAKNAFHNSRRSTQAVENNLGVPMLATYSDATHSNEAVVVPSFHPSYLSHIGILRNEAEGLLAMVLSVAWQTTYLAVKFATSQPPLNRGQICRAVVAEMDARLQLSHPFGQRFAAAKDNFIKARRIYWDGRTLRNKAIDLPTVPLDILPKMINRAKTTGKVAVTTLAGGFGGFEVSFRPSTIPGYPAPYNKQISMLWEGSSDGKD